jgi:transcription antitermination factor NusG
MSSDQFPPGTRVRVIDGTFANMDGVVITTAEAESLIVALGNERPTLQEPATGLLWVCLSIFGKDIPVEVATTHIEAVT